MVAAVAAHPFFPLASFTGRRHPQPLLSPSSLRASCSFRANSRSFAFKPLGSRPVLLFSSAPERFGAPGLRLRPTSAVISSQREEATFDPELRLVLELATDDELIELERILFGPSYFSPLIKSITSRRDDDYYMYGEVIEEREDFIAHLESRFLYLAADARSTLRGWRPSYRSILLGVKGKLGVPCSNKLSTEDLEVEIFLHLLNEHSSERKGPISFPLGEPNLGNSHGSLEVGLSQWKVYALGAIKVGAKELQQLLLKGGGMLTVTKIYHLLAKRFSGKMLLEAVNYEMQHQILKKGGQLAATRLEAKVAELVARKGLTSAAARYVGLRSMMMFLGPLMWGTFLADVVIQMLGTDYARILRAIYAFAQIRLTRTYDWKSNKR